jgi:hypothetical protein
MSSDVPGKMTHALGIGLGLGVHDDQRFEYLRESHRQEAEAEARELQEAAPQAPVRTTHMFRGEELPGPPLDGSD